MKKMIMMAVIALVVLGLLGGGAFFFLKKAGGAQKPLPGAEAAAKPAPEEPKAAAAEDDDDEEEAAPAEGGGEGKEGAGGPAVMVINRMIVNLAGPRKNAFLKCELHILFRNQELGKLATSEKATPENSMIRAMVLEALSGKTVEMASDPEARENIRLEIKDKLNEKYINRHSKEEIAKAAKTGKRVKPPIKDVLVVDWAIQQ